MMKNKFFIVFLFLSVFATAQTIPGYMGKRFTVGVTPMFSPNIIGTVYGSAPFFSLAGNVQYIIGKQREFCFSAKFSNRISQSEAHSYTQDRTIDVSDKYSSVEYAIGIRRFNRAKFAPLGRYSKWEFLVCRGHVNYDDYESSVFDASSGMDKIVNTPGDRVEINGIGGAFSHGRQRVFEDKIVVDFGFKASLLYMNDNTAGSNRRESSVVSGVEQQLNLNPVLNFYLGLGFLAF